MRLKFRGIGLLSVLVFAIHSVSTCQQLYISNEPKMSLQLLTLGTKPVQLTTLYLAAAKLDDLTLNATGQLIYSMPSIGEVDLYDPTTGVNTPLVTGVKLARDLEIEPGGQSMLIASYSPGSIVRFNFSTGTKTILTKRLGTCDGIAYDPYGNLYAVADHNTVVQIDPVSGAIIEALILEPHHGTNGGDGMTYDSYTNSLWVTHDGTTGNALVQIPISAAGLGSTFTVFPLQNVHAPDGIKSDGKGNLYIGSIWTVAVYNIPTNTVSQNIVVKGADGISLVPGTY
jgi:sugar lactone lactonase YvrE